MNEFDLIARLTDGIPRTGAQLKQGIDDDCAVIAGGDRDWLVTTDALIEGVHFRLDWTDLSTLGRKALSVNVSDIAAMGGKPRFFLVSVGLPSSVGPEGADVLMAGMQAVARREEMLLIGGDTVASPEGLVFSITVLGESEPDRWILRSGAKPGDAIFATGTFGGAALGLSALEAGQDDATLRPFIDRHRDPTPRVEVGRSLAATGMLTALIDVSDGLFADLGHIADSSCVGFEIEAESVPCEAAFDDAARMMGCDPRSLALTGGEDYELVFTVDCAREREFAARAASGIFGSVTRIGRIVADASVRTVLDASGKTCHYARAGFDHFG